jgi:hypothetical protein
VAAEQSELVKRLVLPKDHDDIMPPKGGPLPAAQIDVIRRWVAEGAAWPAGVVLAAKDKAKEEAKAELAQKLTTLEKLEIFPESVTLETKRDFHRIVVFATFKDATTRDVTAFADLKVADAKVAAFDGYSGHAIADDEVTRIIKLAACRFKHPGHIGIVFDRVFFKGEQFDFIKHVVDGMLDCWMAPNSAGPFRFVNVKHRFGRQVPEVTIVFDGAVKDRCAPNIEADSIDGFG